jgi:hypothetical protein
MLYQLRTTHRPECLRSGPCHCIQSSILPSVRWLCPGYPVAVHKRHGKYFPECYEDDHATGQQDAARKIERKEG